MEKESAVFWKSSALRHPNSYMVTRNLELRWSQVNAVLGGPSIYGWEVRNFASWSKIQSNHGRFDIYLDNCWWLMALPRCCSTNPLRSSEVNWGCSLWRPKRWKWIQWWKSVELQLGMVISGWSCSVQWAGYFVWTTTFAAGLDLWPWRRCFNNVELVKEKKAKRRINLKWGHFVYYRKMKELVVKTSQQRQVDVEDKELF